MLPPDPAELPVSLGWQRHAPGCSACTEQGLRLGMFAMRPHLRNVGSSWGIVLLTCDGAGWVGHCWAWVRSFLSHRAGSPSCPAVTIGLITLAGRGQNQSVSCRLGTGFFLNEMQCPPPCCKCLFWPEPLHTDTIMNAANRNVADVSCCLWLASGGRWCVAARAQSSCSNTRSSEV